MAEIGSFGTVDVRAWLYDAKNKLVATNDDRMNDWNFAIAGRMQPGYYRLHLEAVGSVAKSAAATTPAPAVVTDSEPADPPFMLRLLTVSTELDGIAVIWRF